MGKWRATLPGMDLDDRAAQDRLLAEVCELVDDQGGDWAATEAILGGRYSGDDLEDALMMALVPLYAYRAPGGPAFVRSMRDALRAAEPAPSRRWSRRRAS